MTVASPLKKFPGKSAGRKFTNHAGRERERVCIASGFTACEDKFEAAKDSLSPIYISHKMQT